VQNIDHEPAVSEPKKSLEKHSAKATDAKNEFAVSCAHCHGADGSGDTVLGRSLKLRDMRSPAAQHYSDSELAAIISTGMDRGRMPGFRKKLGPEMVDQLASYVRVLGGKPPIMAAEKAISAAAANDAPPVSDRPAAQVEVKALAPVRPETQPQQEEGKNTSTVHTVTSAALLPVVVPMSGHGARTELVDLNSASKKILMTLPGIAESDAANIVAGRPYKSTLQFKTRNIVSANTYAQIADRVIAKQPGRTKQPTRGTVGASGSQ
jgi:mono/diheme cytochrome c family protein